VGRLAAGVAGTVGLVGCRAASGVGWLLGRSLDLVGGGRDWRPPGQPAAGGDARSREYDVEAVVG
jgi:hypothetical protein